MLRYLVILSCVGSSALAVDPNWSEDEWTKFEDAIHQVETSGDGIGTIGDGGDAYGPLQIHLGAFTDSGVEGDWEDCLDDLELSKQVLRKYIKRYLPKNGTMEMAACIWNAGPVSSKVDFKTSKKWKATADYRKKFLKHYKESE